MAEAPASGASVAPSQALAAAIAKVNACSPDAEDCEAMDELLVASDSIGPDQYRGAIKLATHPEAREALQEAVAKRIDEPLLLEFLRTADACPEEGDCAASDEFSTVVVGLTPALFRAGIKAAKTTSTREGLLYAIKKKMEPSLVVDLKPWVAEEAGMIGRYAQQALGAIEDTEALKVLVGLLDRHDATDTIHSAVPELLAAYPENPVVKAALPKLRNMAKHDAQGWGKAHAAEAVAKIEGEGAIPFLIECIKTETWGPGRAAVVEALAEFKTNPSARSALTAFAKDADEDVKKAAALALE